MPESIKLNKLKNKAIHYLARFSSTEKKLTQILLNFTKKRCPEIELDEASKHIEETVVWCRENGYVNDYQYLVTKIRTRRLKGESAKQITKKLLNAGTDLQQIKSIIDNEPALLNISKSKINKLNKN